MKSILDKLGLYDLLGYLIPGFMGFIAIKIIYEKVFNFSFPFKLKDNLIDSVVFVIAIYFIGVIFHEISNFIQDKLLKFFWRGFPSERFLLEGDSLFSSKEKETYCKLAKKNYQIDLSMIDKTINQFVFDRFRTSLQVDGKDEKCQIFNAHYGMYRNFSAGSLICFLAFLASILSYLIKIKLLGMQLKFDYSSVLTCILFFVTTYLLFRRAKRFGETYVKCVCRSFYELHKDDLKKGEV